jgi:hypothetical protein
MAVLTVACLAIPGAAFAVPTDYVVLDNFPAPAPASFNVAGANLNDGRLILWNGDQVYVQRFANADAYTRIASGFAGDPSFVALSPSGQTLLMGPGGFGASPYLGQLYTFAIAEPANFSAANIAVTGQEAFSGVFLTETLVLLDVGTPSFSGSVLVVADISGAKRDVRTVVMGLPTAPPEKDTVVEKPPFTYSGSLAVDRDRDIIYAVSSFGAPQEIRYFNVADLINAYNSSGTLDWSVDGTLVGSAGQFFSGGIAGITAEGFLVNGGGGGVQIIDPAFPNPANAVVMQTLDPAGNAGFYSILYNSVTDAILVQNNGVTFAPGFAAQPVPAAGALGLLALAGALALFARRKMK